MTARTDRLENESMPDHDDPHIRFAGAPSNRLLGMELVERSAAHSRVRLPARAELAQEEGVVHGGFLTTLADTAAVYVLLPELPRGHTLASIELKINFLAPARPAAGDIVVKPGRRVLGQAGWGRHFRCETHCTIPPVRRSASVRDRGRGPFGPRDN